MDRDVTRGRRTRVETGIYRDAYGLAALVTVGRDLAREKRFPPDADLDTIRTWRAHTYANLLEDAKALKRQRADPRSITRSIAIYLRTRRGRPSYKADRSHLKAWIPFIGPTRRHHVTRDDVERAIVAWRMTEKSATTIRHRCRVLRELYQALDGAAVHHPLEDVTVPGPVKRSPIPVSHAAIQAVAESLQAGIRHAKGYGSDPILSRARFLVYATTGQRPAQIGRAKPGDVDLERRIWFVRPAKGGEPIPLPLNDEMISAWQVFIDARAWGPFDTSALAKLLRRHGWPEGVRPYTLRHTLAIDLLLKGVPLDDIQGLLGHANIHTTRTFYAPILVARLKKSVEKRRLQLANTPPAVRVPRPGVPGRSTTKGQNAPQKGMRRAAGRTHKRASRNPKRP